jgi:hypothetical protein
MIELNISTDGEKFIIKIFDYNYKVQKISRKISEFEFQAEIPRLCISLIGDNTYSTCHAKNFSAYNRTEICYAILENIIFFYNTETREESCNKDIQIKVRYLEIDNQISPFTNFPIVVMPNNESSNNENEIYFLNAVYSSEDNTDVLFIDASK